MAMIPSDVLNSFPREWRKLIFILSLASKELKDKLLQGENFSIQILHVCLVWILNDNCKDALMALWFEYFDCGGYSGKRSRQQIPSVKAEQKLLFITKLMGKFALFQRI